MSESKAIADIPSGGSINGYDKLSSVLADIIKNSDPNFTIGIYGEWGTGKTTLMQMIEDQFVNSEETDSSKILPIWFNAWRYEREERFAVITFMKTIAYGIEEYEGNSKRFGEIKTVLTNFWLKGLKAVINKTGMDFTDAQFKNIAVNPNLLVSIEKDTIYFDALKKIKEEMDKIRKNDEKCRIVVFVDDLDRCSPSKALEVLESIKVFFDIPGFVYVLGISHQTVSNLINQAYSELNVEGREYIKKIIQVPITLPSWERENLDELLNEISNTMNSERKSGLNDERTRSDIFNVADNNPRQLKRLINSFIVADDTYSCGESLKPSTLFRCLSIQKDKPKLFLEFIKNEEFREKITAFIELVVTIRGSEYRSNSRSGGKAIKPYKLSTYNLAKYIVDAGDDEIKENERARKIRMAFFDFLTGTYESESNKSEESEKDPDPPQYRDISSKEREVRRRFHGVLESGELLKMNIRNWFDLRNELFEIKEKGNLDKYKDAINMMREDLKVDTDNRNLNKN